MTGAGAAVFGCGRRPPWGTADDDYGDLRLRSGSPCVDPGDSAGVPAGVTTDLDGKPRFLDDPFAPDTGSGAPPIVDMGAYEYRRVYVDVRPGACPNPVNRKGRGLIPVVILGTEFFDVAIIDTSALRLVPAGGGGDDLAPVKVGVEDVAAPYGTRSASKRPQNAQRKQAPFHRTTQKGPFVGALRTQSSFARLKCQP